MQILIVGIPRVKLSSIQMLALQACIDIDRQLMDELSKQLGLAIITSADVENINEIFSHKPNASDKIQESRLLSIMDFVPPACTPYDMLNELMDKIKHEIDFQKRFKPCNTSVNSSIIRARNTHIHQYRPSNYKLPRGNRSRA